jgi:endonuclease/exonuclease/phosphatase family metal-dependent hydrolase
MTGSHTSDAIRQPIEKGEVDGKFILTDDRGMHMKLRVLAINVWNLAGDPRRTELINREIRRIAPDLVAFEEVIQTPERNQLEELLAGTDLYGTHQLDVTASAPPWIDRYGGSAVATRWPHRVAEVIDPRLPDAMDVPWATIAVTVPIPEEGELLFISASTSWRLEAESARERQAVALADLDARHRGPLPTIIAGDFNATPEAASIRYLTGLQSIAGRSVHYHDAWSVAGEGPGYTWNVDNPNGRSEMDAIIRQPNHRRRIDYVFVGSWYAHPKAHCYIESAKLEFDRPIDGIWVSDHYGVSVNLDIGMEPTST